jgi:cytoplasmic iron level regulating protein YaaA (DUF328/UPF0246 family)
MLTVISPAKRLDWSPRDLDMTEPVFQSDADALAEVARAFRSKLMKLMGISRDLAGLNAERFARFGEDRTDRRPAAFAFAGDTYAGLEAATLDADALRYAQDHLRILSGLYGLLRPLDAIEAYRLEMGSRLKNGKGQIALRLVGPRLAEAINAEARRSGTEIVVNCASVEYFSAVDMDALDMNVDHACLPRGQARGPAYRQLLRQEGPGRDGALHRGKPPDRSPPPHRLRHRRVRVRAELSEPGKPAFLRRAVAEQAA